MLATALLCALLLASGAEADALAVPQPALRYELGQRLRRLEAAWAGSDEAARRRALPRVQAAVRAFFTLQPEAAARELEEAHRALRGPGAASLLDGAWAEAWAVTPERGLLDGETHVVLGASLLWPEGPPDGAVVEVLLPGDERVWLRMRLGAETQAFLLPLPDGGARRAPLELVFRREDTEVARRALSVPRLPGVDAELARIAREAPALADPLLAASARHLERMLSRLRRGPPVETDEPVELLLADALAALAAKDGDRPFQRPGQHWLAAPAGKGAVPLRIQVPEPAPRPPPLVLALHGAGGSENLFFDGYGNGLTRRLCAARGWLLAAPRVGMFGRIDLPALIESLERHLSFDRERIFVIGHSMGVAAALNNLRAGFRPRAVVALGGVGALWHASDLRATAFFVAAGEEDFALRSARELFDALAASGHPDVQWLEVPATEHLFVVQDALPAAFEFLDARAGRTAN